MKKRASSQSVRSQRACCSRALDNSTTILIVDYHPGLTKTCAVDLNSNLNGAHEIPRVHAKPRAVQLNPPKHVAGTLEP